ncbi:MAG: protein BatD, partial [Flavobacteriaceae bacterium]|nr:protein BatD [Flavobacteriaceae bacterium]
TYNVEQYRYVVIRKALLIPTRSGKLTIEPMEMNIVVGVPTGRGDFFGNPIVRNITKSFSSAKKNLNIKELPLDGKPLNYGGAVGTFDFEVTANKTSLKSNESARISVTVSGKGNLKLFELPEIKTPSKLEVFTPEQKEKVSVTPSGIRGSVSKNYTVVPEYKGKYKIPSTEFSYFDPKKEKYINISSDDIFVEVLGGKEIVTNSENSVIKRDVLSTGSSFRYIQTKSSFVTVESTDFFKSSLYYLLLFLPMLLVPIAIVTAKRNSVRNSDVEGNRLRKADRLAKRYLSEAKKQLGKKEAFYVALEKALHNYLKAKLRMETSDISKEKITALLTKKRVDNPAIDAFIDVFKSCDMARYSPITDGEMNEDFEKAKLVISQIDKQL